MFDQFSTISMTLQQIEEALGEQNAYYFFLKHGRPHFGPMELIRYFIAECLKQPVHQFEVVDEDQPLFV